MVTDSHFSAYAMGDICAFPEGRERPYPPSPCFGVPQANFPKEKAGKRGRRAIKFGANSGAITVQLGTPNGAGEEWAEIIIPLI
jgi:hypothetical protein